MAKYQKKSEHSSDNVATITIENLEALRRDLLDELAKTHEGHTKERAELSERLGGVEAYIKESKAIEAKRDEVHDSKSTLVLPPLDVPTQQPAGANPAEPAGTKEHKSIFHRIW